MDDRNPFSRFDFSLLDDPRFREDSVREELVVPLLAALGYSASPPHRIIRSLRLQHPYVYIGTVRKPISIIPDYVLQRDEVNAWILDAKSPSENIDTGKNVEQAYSYAIHRDIRVPVYALCNGRKLTVFHVSQYSPIADVELREIHRVWPFILDFLGTKAAWPEGRRPSYLHDFGLALRKTGLDRDENGEKYFQVFESVQLRHVARVEDDLYSLTTPYRQEYAPGEFSELMLTLDMAPAAYQLLLEVLPSEFRDRLKVAMTRQPYQIYFKEDSVPLLVVAAEPGDDVRANGDESYCPFIAEEFHFHGYSAA
jgi:hypothetical protein